MDVEPERIQREVLVHGFRSYQRAVIHGGVLSAATVALMWQDFPQAFLVGWLATYYTLLFLRMQLARAFFARTVRKADVRTWTRRSAIGLTATGLAWGVLGVMALAVATTAPLYSMWVIFLIAIFAVVLSYTGSAQPMVLGSFLAGSMGPIIVASLILPATHFWVRLLGETAITFVAIRVGRAGHEYLVEAIRMRFENRELLREVTRRTEELDRANAAKTRFLAAASHDLRQPMQALTLLVEGLQERVQEPGTRRIVDSMRSSVASLSSLLNEILDISRFDAGTVKPTKQSFPVARLLERLRGPSSYIATQRYLGFRIRPCDAIVATDEVLLYRILANLVENALRYTARGGVLVACRKRELGLSIEVWDTGIGIAADQLDKIFLEFHQLANPQRDRQQGLGLGLAIVERAARVLDLTIEVRSRPGRGSVFSVLVPYGDAGLVHALEGMSDEPLEGCAVLVVEDDREIRDAMVMLLEQWKCRVATASSMDGIEAALRQLATAPDMVIADYRLPNAGTGLDAIALVKSKHPHVCAVITTGDVSTEALRDMRSANHPILHKPLKPARLRALLGSARRARLPTAPKPAVEAAS